MAFNPDAYLADKQPQGFDPDAYLTAKQPATTADAVPKDTRDHSTGAFLRDTWEGMKGAADEFSSKPLAKIAADHIVQPAVDAYNHARDAGHNVVNSALDAGAKATGTVADIGKGFVMPGVTPLQTYLQSLNSGASHTDALKDAGHIALLLGAPAAAGKLAEGAGWVAKKGAKGLAGVNEGSIDRYLANPEAVNAAADLPTKTKEFLADADARKAQGSADSTASFNTLHAAGSTPAENITGPLSEAADHIKQFGVQSEDQLAAQRGLLKQAENIKAYVDDGGQMPLDKGKALINVLRTKATQLEGRADPQTLKAYGDAIKTIDQHLKSSSPEYAKQMEALKADTQAATGLTDRFRTDQGAMNTLKRVQNGRDPFASEALAGYDKQFGTKFGDDLQDSFAKNDFTKANPNGSRRAVTFGAAGAAIGNHLAPGAGGYVGGALGAGVGALTDVYGGAAVKAALDLGINLKNVADTPFIKPLMEAAQRGPKALAVTHALLSKNFPGYAATQTEDAP